MTLVNNLITFVDSFRRAETILYANLVEHAMNALEGLLGAQAGSGVLSALNRLIDEHGGVQGVVSHLTQRGLVEPVKSWVSRGPNQPISSDQVLKVLGSGTMLHLGVIAGMSVPDLGRELATFLPQVIDKLTPNGELSN